MGQSITTATNFIVSVFEPVLVPKVYGIPFVVLRVVIGDEVLEDHIDAFPALRGFPMTYFKDAILPQVLEVEVVVADSLEAFRAGRVHRPYSVLSIPLKLFTNVWVPGSSDPAKEVCHEAGTACMWLGLSEEISADGGGDVHMRFEYARAAGQRLLTPKFLIALHSGDVELRGDNPFLWPTSYGCAPVIRGDEFLEEAKIRVQAEHKFLGHTDILFRGLHSAAEEARLQYSDHDALVIDNAELRQALAKQQERVEELFQSTEDLKAAATCLPNDERRKQEVDLSEVSKEIQFLENKLVEQQQREEDYQKKTVAAKQATAEIMKLCEEKEKEIKSMHHKHAESNETLERLRVKYESFRGVRAGAATKFRPSPRESPASAWRHVDLKSRPLSNRSNISMGYAVSEPRIVTLPVSRDGSRQASPRRLSEASQASCLSPTGWRTPKEFA
mmetsp:Transcript_52349/g.139402  ORF Transcript_52349/g.139402 Transcript_52349/m.139402 type:complete len:445 (-) Transcript_52349:275-1609(-)